MPLGEFVTGIKSFFQLTYYFDRLKQKVDFLKPQIVSFITASGALGGIIFGYFEKFQFATISLGFGLTTLSTYVFLSRREEQENQTGLNPHLMIENDTLKIHVYANGRLVEQQLRLKALKNNITAYKFKFYWTGSSQECKVISLNNDVGTLYGHNPNVQGAEIRWQFYEFRFFQPLNKGEEKSIFLSYSLPDPSVNAKKYHLVSYRHVKGCNRLKFHLTFDAAVMHQKAFLRYLDQNQNERSTEDVGFFRKTQEYITNVITPKSGMKYSIHWE